MHPLRRRHFPALLVIGAALAIAGCEETGTPEGEIAEVLDLRQYLTDDVKEKAPVDDESIQHQATVEMGEAEAEVQVTWSTFELHGRKYVLSVRFDALSDSLLQLDAGLRGAPVLSADAKNPVQVVPLLITWQRHALADTAHGSVLLEVSADGSARPY